MKIGDVDVTNQPKSWVAFIICCVLEMFGLSWVIDHGCSWQVLAVHVVALFGFQVVVTGRSILEDVADVARAWRGNGTKPEGKNGPDAAAAGTSETEAKF